MLIRAAIKVHCSQFHSKKCGSDVACCHTSSVAKQLNAPKSTPGINLECRAPFAVNSRHTQLLAKAF